MAVSDFLKTWGLAKGFNPGVLTGERKTFYQRDRIIAGLLSLFLFGGILIIVLTQKPVSDVGTPVFRKTLILFVVYFVAWLGTLAYRYKHQRLLWQLYQAEQRTKQ
jgi:uncharacterized protein YacL